ncbi:NADH-ubiquinone dehydrogenase [Mesorhizobium sp. J428]|uniref:NADH-ubiquinone dehydrogenase n=1 Tax=Mesorhizobium sp. J428 TaxID=2898440 RepID=UPI0021510D2A|nr:NADH-ubiquinone dehydrogenase [Mesorhizobium sp. J428]MCR5859587.1 NADH-ubiquinone dehydrogenase [Mesorhizobium sp. J428]
MTNDALPGGRLPDADDVVKLKQQVSDMMPREFENAARLMAQPIAGAAALSALGFGMATQAFGFWLTAVSTAMRAGHEIAHAGEREAAANPSDEAKPASLRAKATAEAVIADAKAAATDAGDKVVKFVSKAERAAKVAKAPKHRAAPPAKAVAPAPTAVKPVARARAKAADDLKAIGGIGPKLETVLNGLGIRTYAQVAALTASEIESIEDKLGFKGRIGRDDWVGQARALVKGGKA